MMGLCQIESWENAAEKWADENIKGDRFKCGCGKWADLANANTADPNPYSRPICPECFEEWIKKAKEQDTPL